MNKNYLEWCLIMKQEPNKREEMIFTMGAIFNQIENQAKQRSNHTKKTERTVT